MKQEVICIVCPRGCHVTVEDGAASGAHCERGTAYALRETMHPTRVVTSTVRISGGLHPRLPVKTDRDIPKELIRDAVRLLDGVAVAAPAHMGDIVAGPIDGTEANWVATRDMGAPDGHKARE